MTPRGKIPLRGKAGLKGKKKMPMSHYIIIGVAVMVPVVAILAWFVLSYLRQTVQDVPGHNNIQTLAVLYGRYVGQHRGKPPSNLEELKAWIKKQDPTQLENLQVDPSNLDALFTSPRDHQPYAFVAGASSMSPGPEGKGSVVIHEQTGVGGKRLIVYSLGRVEEVDEATFNRVVSGK